MKLTYFIYIFALAGIVACTPHSNTTDDDHSGDNIESKEKEEHDHGEEIILHRHAADEFGVKVTAAEPREFSETIKVGGRLLPSSGNDNILSAKSSGIVTFKNGINLGSKVRKGESIASLSSRGMTGGDSNESAASAVEMAKKELDRLKPLYEEQIIPQKDYIAAQNAYKQALIAHSGSNSGSVVTTSENGVITELFVKPGTYVEAGQPIARVSSSRKLVLRADLPEKYKSKAGNIISANIRTVYQDSAESLSSHNGRMIVSAEDSYPVSPGYIPVYFEFDNDGTFSPESSCEVYLIGNKRNDVITIPENAIIEQMGQKYAYIRVDEEGYVKKPLKLGTSDGMYSEVISGIEAGDSVVIEGVTFIKLAETKNVAPQGHTHNH